MDNERNAQIKKLFTAINLQDEADEIVSDPLVDISDKLIETSNMLIGFLNKKGLCIEVFETSENYGDEDFEHEDEYEISEDDPFYMHAMYEGFINNIDDEEEVEDTRTGRYCDITAVLDELIHFGLEHIEPVDRTHLLEALDEQTDLDNENRNYSEHIKKDDDLFAASNDYEDAKPTLNKI